MREKDSWSLHIPTPIDELHPEYIDLYNVAWNIVHNHKKEIPGMPQSPYMDEAFCETQIWIWDTCFMSLFCKYAQEEFPGKESLQNFYEVLHGDKRLPKVKVPDDEPFWTGAKPGEHYEIEIHIADNPPLFAWSEYENALFHGDKTYISKILHDGYMQKHFFWWESLKEKRRWDKIHCPTHLKNEGIGYKWEGGASGMDNTPRGRNGIRAEAERPNNSNMLWLDAICQQALSAKCISKLYELIDDYENRDLWNARYEEKKNIVNQYYWDEEDNFYYDIDVNDHHKYKVKTIASYWALLAEIASPKQAKSLLDVLLDEKQLGGDIPLLSLSRSDNDFDKTGKYWRGSLWLPTAYATLRGLAKYQMYDEAHEFAKRILNAMSRTYQDNLPHTIWECYSPTKYEPGMQVDARTRVRPDFCGWSALGPISIYIEFYLGIHTVDAFKKQIEWNRPKEIKKRIGIDNLHFGDIITSMSIQDDVLTVESNDDFTLILDGETYPIHKGQKVYKL